MVADRYRLTRELGRGGMGVVWQAYDELLQRDVAVKEVHFPPDLTDEERERLAGRTLSEARAVAAVDTHAAVRVFDVVEQDGRPWIVMELVRGRTLTEVLHERSALPPREVAGIGLTLLEALEVAHAAGVLHRDVKPGNVLIGDDGRIALTDFGIATVDGERDGADTTTTGVIVGSPAYVAPERVHGEPATAASDLWSLGATLWTAAEGRPPYAGDTSIAVLSAVAMHDAPPCTRCTGPLGDLLRGLLDRDPARRPDAARVRGALEAVAADPDASMAPTAPYPTEQLPASFDRTTVLESVAPPVSDPAPTGGRGPGIRRALVVLAILFVVAGVVAAMLLMRTPDSGSQAETTDRPSRSQADDGGGSGSDTTTDVPDGWTRYDDPSGDWSVGIPAGWQATESSSGTRFDDPAGGRYLLVATRTPAAPSAVGAWHESERAFRTSHGAYERIRLERIDVEGADDAADWEFTYVEDEASLHAIDRAIVVGDTGYALYFQTHADQWESSQPLFEQIDATFQPS
jgi:eukaryotic-like serine/threonine-protein kinase